MKDTKELWFKDGKYGLFIHWGLYSILAGEYKGRRTDHIAEWIMNHLDIPVEEYRKLANEFNPVDWDAEKVVKKAKGWGMKYLVFTSKHHDGFAMYHSKVSPYNIVDATPYGRDVVSELAEACKKYNMRFGLYYSQSQDWDDPNGNRHLGDNSSKDFQKYFDGKCLPQVKELLTDYGDISLLWFDTPMSMTESQSRYLIKTVKELQPHCIVSGRIGSNMGDYMTTSDNFIPANAYLGDWEVPATLNDTWGFNKYDANWKNSREILNLLLKINSRGGNYLLNIGPDGTGRIPEESIKILNEVADYVIPHEEGIYATRAIEGNPYELEYGLLTHRKNKIFIHVIYKGKYRLELQNIANKLRRVTLLSNGETLDYFAQKTCEGNSMIEIELPEEFRYQTGYCVCLETEEEEILFEKLPQ